METVCKVVRVDQEEDRDRGGRSARLEQDSDFCLAYRKDVPTGGPHPLFAFRDLALAEAFAGTRPDVAIWEAEAPSCEPAPEWLPESYDLFIANYWEYEYEAYEPIRPGETRHPPTFWFAAGLAMRWMLAPEGTVLCPSITLRRLISPTPKEA